MKPKLYIITLFIVALALWGCQSPPRQDTSDQLMVVSFDSTDEHRTFETKEELLAYLQQSSFHSMSTSSDIHLGGIMDGSLGQVSMEMSDSMVKDSARSQAPASGSAASYSETNVQVKGVDEADIVKNDGRYIYTLSGKRLVIVDAYPADNARIVSETVIEGSPQQLFINDDRLVVFSSGYEEFPVIAEYDFIPRPQWSSVTHALLYDISDRSKPVLIQDYSLKGSYYQSRMIDDHIYFVVNEYMNWWGGPFIDVPVVRAGEKTLFAPRIHYFDNPNSDFNFNTVASFDITKDDDIRAETYLLGYSNTLYVSQDSIYITYQKNLPYSSYQDHQKDRFFTVVVPLLPQDIRSQIQRIGDDPKDWDKVSAVLEEMYNKLPNQERSDLIERIEDAIEEYEAKIEAERRKTVIHKIDIDKGDIRYDTRGEVPGYLLNQFSMDEHEGNLRLATTTFIWSGRSQMYNNVFVLDDGLEIIGKLEDIAPDERIYSARFIADRLYMVTFKQIDPFFVIDLKDPRNPAVLGELKIPGYSDYLHPYDEDHIIGIGKETEGNQWGGISTRGVKLALFDVSDVNNPVQVDNFEIGDSGTDSEALTDHKAFLFDKEKDLLVIPVREVKSQRYYDSRLGYYRQDTWQGAYVFGLDPQEGFSVKGKISHAEGSERSDYWYASPTTVRRALYMDDVLYTISPAKIMMNDIDSIEEIGSVALPYEQEQYARPWY